LDTTRAATAVLDGIGRGRVVIAASKPRDRTCSRLPIDYMTAVRRAGGDPYVISTFSTCAGEPEVDDLEMLSDLAPDETHVLEGASGLLLTGGGDVDPSTYGQSPHARTYNVSARRDRFEFNLLDVALERDMPVLAICRGMQVLNVHLGGTLEQHLREVEGRLDHDRDRARAEPAHDVRIEPGSRLVDWLGERAGVNSHHHQGLDRVAEPLEEVAYADDGVLEAVVSRDHEWVVGVQWHPEAMVPLDDKQLAIFEGFVEASQRYARLTARARSA
jgi:putative glutamine amidotransferase